MTFGPMRKKKMRPTRANKPNGYLLGSYRIATAPEPNSSRLTSLNVHRKIRTTSLETSAVVVHGCDGRPDDSAASRGIYGKENGCHGPQSSCESCSHGLSP